MPMLEVNAQDNNIPVRVGISNTSFNTYLFDTVEFNDAQNIEIMDSATGYVAPKSSDTEIYKITSENNLFRIYKDDVLVARNLTGPVLVRPVQGASYVSINNLKRKGQQAFYRGYIELTRSKKNTGKFAIVNVLSLKNFSDVTKKAIKYLFLNNNELESLSGLEGFVNVYLLRIERNNLRTFQYLENMIGSDGEGRFNIFNS